MMPTKDYELMENMFSDFPDFGQVHYYRKKMPTQTDRGYSAHVFFTDPMPSAALAGLWKKITAVIAVRIQSEVEELIERSNFYICFFVKDEPGHALISAVESDEFCARKYVLPPFDGAECTEEIIEKINQKLFYFTDRPAEAAPGSGLHVGKVTLTNFRAYENTRELVFGSRGNDASLVLIYAKNGVGKTSIFDGMEYLFKGAVERIQNLENTNKKSKSPSATLHNLSHREEEASVSVLLSDDRLLRRKVQSLGGSSKNDLKRYPVKKSEGRDFIGPLEESDKWNEIILPHDRIDGFTTVKSPEEVYKEWIRHSNLQPQSDKFLSINKALKDQGRKNATLVKEEKELRAKIEELSKGREEVEEIIRLIGEFNALKNASGFPVADDLALSAEDATRSYDQLINSAKACARQIGEEREGRVVPGKNELGLISRNGRKYYEEAHQSYHGLVEMKTRLQKALDAANEAERLEAEIAQAERNQVECERQLDQIRQILDLGGETRMRQAAREIEERKHRKASIQARLVDLTAALEETDARIARVAAAVAVQKTNINDKYPAALAITQEYRTEARTLADLRQAEARYQNDIDGLTASINSNRLRLDDLREIRLPGKLSQLDSETVQRCGELIGNDKTRKVYELRNKYVKIEAQEDELDRQTRMSQTGEDELSVLLRLAEKYVSDHPEIQNCPVCGKHHRDHERLLKEIGRHSLKKQDSLQAQLGTVRDQAASLEKEYSEEAAFLKKEMESLDRELVKSSNNAVRQRMNLTESLDTAYKGIKEAGLRLSDLKASLTGYGISCEGDPTDAVGEWYLSVTNELAARRRESESLAEERNALNALCREARQDLEKESGLLTSMQEDAALQWGISFVADRTADWSAENEHKDLLRRIAELTRIRGSAEERLAAKRAREIPGKGLISRQLEELGPKIEALSADEEIYKKYYAGEDDTLAAELAELEGRDELCRREVDLLSKIVEENSARSYFEDYRQVLEAQEKKAADLKDARKEERELKRQRDALKTDLEQELHSFFNQPAMSSIFRKIDPHRRMKDVHYVIEFSEDGDPQLYTKATDGETEIRPEWYFSTAQLNTLVFSTFFSRALKSDLPLKTIFVDDPIAHFDDMNILGFADLLRCLIIETPFQFVISTHDRKIYDILRRKLDAGYYRSSFIEL